MIERYEKASSSSDFNELYQKLHEEILGFRDSVHDILAEMQPVKDHLI